MEGLEDKIKKVFQKTKKEKDKEIEYRIDKMRKAQETNI